MTGSKKALNNEISQLESTLAGVSEQAAALKEKEQQIINTQAELEQTIMDAQEQYESMKARIRFMYENGNWSFWDVLSSADSIADILNWAEYILQISQYDRKMLIEYENTIEKVAQLEEEFAKEQGEAAVLKEQVSVEQVAAAALLEEKEQELAPIEQELSKQQSIAQEYKTKIQDQNEIIYQLQLEYAVTIGGFIWPCPSSTYVTSDYGYRESPTVGASSNHQGIDISANYGADIVAAASGTVIFAGYNDNAGNHIKIDHGNGIVTVYLHCSSLAVSSGQSVTIGQVIGKVGSTGTSTGNHLHFGVQLNGEYVSPWNYLSR